MKGKLIVPIACLLMVGCGSSVEDARHLSVVVEANHSKPDGTPWDNGGGEFTPMWGPMMFPAIFSTSTYPDLALTVIGADGTVKDYNAGETRFGVLNSDCENRLSCRWEIEVPATAFAIIATDLDIGLNPDMTVTAIKQALGMKDGEPPTGEKPLRSTRQFVAGHLFAGQGGIDPEQMSQLEAKVRKWMDAARVDLIPRVSLPVHDRDGCREQSCPADVDGNSGSLAITAVPNQPKQGDKGTANSLWEALTKSPTDN
jgi:hypothetical protein